MGAFPAHVGTHRQGRAAHRSKHSPRPHHPPRVNDDWFDTLPALLGGEASFLVIGAQTLAVHGVPRGTQELDVRVEPSPENAERVWRANRRVYEAKKV